MSWSDYIGRFHPVLVHLPIGILLAAIFLEGLSHVKGFRKVRRAVRVLLLLGFLLAGLTALTGYLHAQTGEFDEGLAGSHQSLAFATTFFAFLAWLLRGGKRQEVRLGYYVVLFALTILIILTGHSGGSITHGIDYLTPGPADDGPGNVKLELKPDAQLYADLVAPVLKKNCVGCHGPTRQKAKLRLDQPEFIRKGGKDGEIINASMPEESELWRRITLDIKDEDHMPPREKSPLATHEIALITYWLQTGADFNAKLSTLPRADSIIALLEGSKFIETENKIEDPVTPPPAALLDEFRKAGVAISFLAQDDGRIAMQFINAEEQPLRRLLATLPNLQQQLVDIRLPGKNLSHQEWRVLTSLPELTKLGLEHSNFSDDDLPALVSCQHLTYLNLVDTQITTKGLMSLEMKSLEQLYLFQTDVQPADLQALQARFPKAAIVLGNYQVPTLPGDTAEQKTKYVPKF